MGPAAVARGLGEDEPGDNGEVPAEDALELTGTEVENVIQKRPSHSAHPALGERIGPRSLEGQPNYPYALASEHLVEGCAELLIPVTK